MQIIYQLKAKELTLTTMNYRRIQINLYTWFLMQCSKNQSTHRAISITEIERIYEEAYNCVPTEPELNALYTALIEQDTAYLW